jgi:hypothetical protein
LEDCEKNAETESEPAESVTVSNISEDGESATAEVAITGGSLEGQSVEVGLMKEEGDWKLNEFSGFTKYDPANIASQVEEQLSEEGGATAAIASCVAEGIEEMSEEEAEAMVFEKDNEGVEEIATACNE